MSKGFADQVRELPDDQLAALLRLRPDLVVPAPADLCADPAGLRRPVPAAPPPARAVLDRLAAGPPVGTTATERRLTGPAQVPAHERRLTGPAQVPAHERRLTGPAQVPAQVPAHD